MKNAILNFVVIKKRYNRHNFTSSVYMEKNAEYEAIVMESYNELLD